MLFLAPHHKNCVTPKTLLVVLREDDKMTIVQVKPQQRT